MRITETTYIADSLMIISEKQVTSKNTDIRQEIKTGNISKSMKANMKMKAL